MGPKSTFQNELQQTLQETRSSLRSVKTLTQTLNEQPNSLIFGKKKNKSATLNEP
jgi:paraquat-inducible protein B